MSSRKISYSMFRAKSGRSLLFEKKMRTRKTQNIKINITCGLDFRLEKLYLFLHIFNIFARKLKIRSHLKSIYFKNQAKYGIIVKAVYISF
jgi:hypothetical protein